MSQDAADQVFNMYLRLGETGIKAVGGGIKGLVMLAFFIKQSKMMAAKNGALTGETPFDLLTNGKDFTAFSMTKPEFKQFEKAAQRLSIPYHSEPDENDKSLLNVIMRDEDTKRINMAFEKIGYGQITPDDENDKKK